MTAASKPLSQAERTALSDSRMIDAAICLIVERGPEKTTLKALGEVSGYSRGLVTYRFGSKAGLFKAMIKAVSERWLAKLEKAIRGKQGLDAILATTDAYYRFVSSSPKDIRAMQILFHKAVEPGSELADIVRRIFRAQRDQLAAWARAAQREKVVAADVDPEVFAARFCAYTSGITWSWMLKPRDVDWAGAQQEFKRMVLAELTTPKGQE
ncbi:MAG: TetR family transcriptional regulator [Xanthomonadales bacterium]|nr:TetR family transcriptional regulator [Xanthomonadales bacterium]